ncbi:MAG TPA: sugar ABC transporter ATP-binding protein [Verrucomicrobiales bacterium]|nr:sugar ABC transporter ATP-binding protein [Verrucomicrobiales bacterium]
MSPPLLEARGISKAFRGAQALSGVDLTLREGEIHALMGENGAGKSTLIKVLTGVHPPDAGTIQWEGRPIQPRTPHEAEGHGISTVYQEVNLVPNLSIADNLLLGRQPTRLGLIRGGEVRRRASASLTRLGLDLDVRAPLGSCSLAVQQMVAIARALDIQARLLILDEPTSSLDEREVATLFSLLGRLKEKGLAILFVTHFLDQVYALADRITVLRNGARVGDYPVAELPRLRLIEAMLGREFHPVSPATDAPRSDSPTPPEAFTPLLEARGLGRSGGMNPVDLSIHPGEILGLSGLLGSGRTETARMLFGVDRPDQGSLRINGAEQEIRSPREGLRLGLAYCAEDRKAEGIIPNLSVRENLILAVQAGRGPLRLMGRAEQETLADHYIRALNIRTASRETPIRNLSGGNQQKVLLARWLALQPKLILLDEPTRGIDVGAKAEIERLVASLRGAGTAVLFISSDLEEMVRNCQRVAVLKDRRKIGELAGADITPSGIMRLIAHHEG